VGAGRREGHRGSARWREVSDATPRKAAGAREVTIDLTARAASGKLDPVIAAHGSPHIQVLQRRTKNNPVLIGEPGVGKTAIVEGLRNASSTARCRRA